MAASTDVDLAHWVNTGNFWLSVGLAALNRTCTKERQNGQEVPSERNLIEGELTVLRSAALLIKSSLVARLYAA